MKVWLVTVGESMPTIFSEERPMRTTLLARELAARGHEVVWWNTTWHHFRKIHVQSISQDTIDNSGFVLRLVPGIGYTKNFSFRRLIDHVHHAYCVFSRARQESAPNIIVSSYPTIELSFASIMLGKAFGIPVIIDIRDLWPATIAEAASSAFRKMINFALWPYECLARYVFRHATAIYGVSETSIEWALSKVSRQKSAFDKEFVPGYPVDANSIEESDQLIQFWERNGLQLRGEQRDQIGCYFGILGKFAEISAIIRAAQKLQIRYPNLKLVICGTGDRLADYREQAREVTNIIFPGQVSFSAVQVLMRYATFGIAPFRDSLTFRTVIPNKFIEYLSEGLPVVWGIQQAECARIIQKFRCGLTYSSEREESFLEAVSTLLDNFSLQLELAGNAKKLFNERYKASKVYAEYADSLELLVGSA